MCDSLCNVNDLKFLWKYRGNKNYHLENFISNGSFIQYMVFEDQQNKRKVLGKIVTSPREGEAYHWPRLKHENLAPLTDIISINEKISVYMLPFIGRSLKSVITDKEFMIDCKSFDRKKAYTEDILWALDYLHDKSLCFMNLTDAIISVCDVRDKAILCDFSCIFCHRRACKKDVKLPVLYQAPELSTEYFEPISAEVWACGVVLLQMFTAYTLPSAFIGNEVHQILQDIREINYDVIKEASPGSKIDFSTVDDLKLFLGLFLVEDPEQRVDVRIAVLSPFLASLKAQAVTEQNNEEFQTSRKEFENEHTSGVSSYIYSSFGDWKNSVLFEDLYLKEVAGYRDKLKKVPHSNKFINLDHVPDGDSISKNTEDNYTYADKVKTNKTDYDFKKTDLKYIDDCNLGPEYDSSEFDGRRYTDLNCEEEPINKSSSSFNTNLSDFTNTSDKSRNRLKWSVDEIGLWDFDFKNNVCNSNFSAIDSKNGLWDLDFKNSVYNDNFSENNSKNTFSDSKSNLTSSTSSESFVDSIDDNKDENKLMSSKSEPKLRATKANGSNSIKCNTEVKDSLEYEIPFFPQLIRARSEIIENNSSVCDDFIMEDSLSNRYSRWSETCFDHLKEVNDSDFDLLASIIFSPYRNRSYIELAQTSTEVTNIPNNYKNNWSRSTMKTTFLDKKPDLKQSKRSLSHVEQDHLVDFREDNLFETCKKSSAVYTKQNTLGENVEQIDQNIKNHDSFKNEAIAHSTNKETIITLENNQTSHKDIEINESETSSSCHLQNQKHITIRRNDSYRKAMSNELNDKDDKNNFFSNKSASKKGKAKSMLNIRSNKNKRSCLKNETRVNRDLKISKNMSFSNMLMSEGSLDTHQDQNFYPTKSYSSDDPGKRLLRNSKKLHKRRRWVGVLCPFSHRKN